MKKRTILLTGGLILLVLFLLLNKRGTKVETRAPEKVPGLATVHYEVPPLQFEVLPPGPAHDPLFDWTNGENCCDGVGDNALVITSLKVAPRRVPGYTYIPNLDLDLPPALKGVPSLDRFPGVQSPPTYLAAVPTFWWGWQGLSRVIYTSDGFTLRTGLKDRLWQDVTPGRNAISTITVIRYNAQEYRLDASKSSGL